MCASFPKLSEPLKKYGARLAPYIMIGIGVYILLNTGTDLVPDSPVDGADHLIWNLITLFFLRSTLGVIRVRQWRCDLQRRV